MFKKALAIILVSIGFFLWSPYFAPVLEAAGKVVAAVPAIENIRIHRDVQAYDTLDPDFQLLMALTNYYYSRITDFPLGYNSGFSMVRVSGRLSNEISLKCGCGGYTDVENKIVVVLAKRYTLSDESRIVSHELTHVLQYVHGAFGFLPKITMEYQAELVSRMTMTLRGEGIGSLDSVPMDDIDFARLKKSLEGFNDPRKSTRTS